MNSYCVNRNPPSNRGLRAALWVMLGFTLSIGMPTHAQQGPRPDTAAGGRDAPRQSQEENASKPAARGRQGALKDPIELCDKLAGTEREICLQRARENPDRASAPSISATPGNSGTAKTSASGDVESGSRER